MNNLNDLVSAFKVPHIFRDVIFFSGGFLFLLILNYYYSPNLDKFPNIEFFDGFGVYLALFVVSYVIGRLLVMLSNIYLAFLNFFFIKNKKEKLKNWFTEFINYKNAERITVQHKESFVSNTEIYKVIQDNQFLFNNYERAVYEGLFLRIFLSIAFFFTFFICWYFFILTIVITFVIEIESIDEVRDHSDIVDFLKK